MNKSNTATPLEYLLSQYNPKKNVLRLEDICFKEQLDFIKDKSPWVTSDCSRRAGKTEVCAIDLLDTALNNPGTASLYITLTRANAERLLWAKLLALNHKYDIGGVDNNSKLSLTFPNKSVIYLSGCKDKSELDKFRGLALKLIYIDEVQSFKNFVRSLVDDVLGPTLADYAGSLKLIGTPAPLRSGFFWDSIQSKAYSHHHWTFWQNPFIAKLSGKTHEEILQRELDRRGVNRDHPSIRREWFGEWTIDTDALVIHYDEHKNGFIDQPMLTDCVISVDLGHDDADAIAVIGWHKNIRKCYLIEESVQSQQGITELAVKIEALVKKYNPLKIVMDTGGLGKKIAEEIRKRYAIPIVAAEKSRKIEFLALLDDALRTQSFYAKGNSRFAEDSYIVEWDYDKSTSDKLVVKEEPHSDIIDSVLYGYREALHWLSEPVKIPVKINTKEAWVKHTNKLMEDSLEKQIQEQSRDEKERDFWNLQNLDGEEAVLSYYVNKRKS